MDSIILFMTILINQTAPAPFVIVMALTALHIKQIQSTNAWIEFGLSTISKFLITAKRIVVILNSLRAIGKSFVIK